MTGRTLETPKKYWQTALCYLSFLMGYLMTNTIPYAPFMSVDLLPDRATSENVGKYSAFFTSCFIWGRSRKVQLVVCLVINVLFRG